jgi:DNA-binding LacI/PurR family transcriptional regulator
MPRKPTLKEVAAQAGVSYQTVSKVLNKQVQVSKQTENRILDAVRSLGYRPNLIARSMRLQESRMIGYSWIPSSPEEANPILDEFLQSMALAAETAGYHLLCFPHHFGQDTIAAYRDLIDTNRVDGFIISSVEYNDPRILFLQERSFPFVAFGRSNPELVFPYVDVDGAEGMRLLVEHLLGLGHRRIGALAWPEDSRVGQNRMEGYLAGLTEAGISPAPELIVRSEGNYQAGQVAALKLLNLPDDQRPTAIMAFNDVMAIGAMRAVQDRGLQVGPDIAITGFDDAPVARFLTPPLTSVCQPIWDIGRQAIAILLELLSETDAQITQTLVKPEIMVRASSGGKIKPQ